MTHNNWFYYLSILNLARADSWQFLKTRVETDIGLAVLAILLGSIRPVRHFFSLEYEMSGMWYALAVILAYLLVLLVFHGFRAPARLSAEQREIAARQRRRIVILEARLLQVADRLIPGPIMWCDDILFHISRNSSDPGLSTAEIEARIQDQAERGRIIVKAVPSDADKAVDVPRHVFKSHTIRLGPDPDKQKWSLGQEERGDGSLGYIHPLGHPEVRTYDAPRFLRSQIETNWPMLGREGREKRRQALDVCPCCRFEEALSYVHNCTHGPGLSPSPSFFLREAVQEERIIAWIEDPESGMKVKVTRDNVCESFPEELPFIPIPGSSHAAREEAAMEVRQRLWFCKKELRDLWPL